VTARRGLRALALSTALAALAACGGDNGRSIEAFCDQLDRMNSSDLLALDVDLDDSDAVRTALSGFADDVDRLAAAAPEEIRASAEGVATFGRALADAALAADPDDPFDRAALLASASATVPTIEIDNQALTNFASRFCTPAPG
jgi:hypothetical protein